VTRSKNVLNVSPKTRGKKESIVLTTRHTKDEKAFQPKNQLLETGLNKETKKGVAALAKAMDGRNYRRDLLALATTKYGKIRKSFKKKKTVVKSRRSGK